MYELSLKDFRGFRDTTFVPIRPITILVGENSAGKSSFLAGLKYMVNLLSAREMPSFNKDPFQLGTFQQIAHFRGGKAGRAKQFQLNVRTSMRISSSDTSSSDVHFIVTFSDVEGHAAISDVSIRLGQDVMNIKFDGGVAQLFATFDKMVVPLENSFSSVASVDFGRFWPFMLRHFEIKNESLPLGNALSAAEVKKRADKFGDLTMALQHFFRSDMEATSAIRTKPLRTYTPGIESRDGEGSHVPYEMAKLSRARNKEEWRRLKSSIEGYGAASEMFKEVSIRSFGNTASDPFQIQFSSGGPNTNLVDLGYGTSQILPILYDVATSPTGSRFLIQQPEVHLHPKAQAALGTYFIDAFRNSRKQFVLETHSDFIVDRIRNAVLEGGLTRRDISLLFFERRKLDNKITEIKLDERGAPINPPAAYRNFFMDEQLKVLGL